MSPSFLVIGNESLTIQCAGQIRARGHDIAALVTDSADVRAWGQAQGLRVVDHGPGLADRLAGLSVDWLLSIANLRVIPAPVLALARRGAVNFHDGPLPQRAGLNAPVWAILAGETRHAICWHMIEGGIDEGDILVREEFAIASGDTALTLNTRCFEAALDSFPALLDALETGAPPRQAQDLAQRGYHARDDRPAAAGRIDFAQPAEDILRLVQALDHGSYRNPLTTPKIAAPDGRVLSVGAAEPFAATSNPGTVIEATDEGLVVACADGAVRLMRLTTSEGAPVSPRTVAVPGAALPMLDETRAAVLTAALAEVAPGEARVAAALARFVPAELPEARVAPPGALRELPLETGVVPMAAAALALARLCPGQGVALLRSGAPVAPGYLSAWAPLILPAAETPVAAAREALAADMARLPGAFPLDLIGRTPGLSAVVPTLALSDGPALGDCALTVACPPDGAAVLHYDPARLSEAAAARMAARLRVTLAALDQATGRIEDLPLLPPDELALVTAGWNATGTDYPATTIPRAFEAQVARTPDAPALVVDAETLDYASLNAAANRVAHVLRAMDVGPGTLVGLCTRRSPALLIGALGILKAGGAYVPLDPAYPADRIALYIEDSGCPVIVTEPDAAGVLPAHGAQVLTLGADPRLETAPTDNPEGGAGPADLAYLIFTSGSTGRPKGVMVEHRNVANFFTGMDDRIDRSAGACWLAVTSLSFDISVLELFWTLSRGFKLVLTSDDNRALVSRGRIGSDRQMDFSLYYWGNDDGSGPQKYNLLLEGAKFADSHGFCAVWTPERHFHAFGGPYPNPSVTGAAVAAVTRQIGVRAGSCVAPLHHPARIAEEWAVIDNLTNGRAGLAFASGWQPDDFVLRPENTPPANKAAMLTAIDQVRRLWRGETVEFPTATGSFGVVTQPRPVSAELPVWVTTAGNPDTWREAGQIGANVLTHLLGQSVDEVAGKIRLYHDALRKAGHDPARFTVTLMLHTYVARDRDQAREVARGPMKDYLRSAAGLIKQYAWAFPAFKKPQGAANPMDIDLRTLSEDELEGILDFAFQRYFDDSGLFGSVEDALARVDQLKRIGVDEIACLIDYGIAPDQVMEGLYPLAEVVRRANQATVIAPDDFSIAAQIHRHKVTHLQCTPSMARMIVLNDDARASLAGVRQILLGGEALPGALVEDLRAATEAKLSNMYGPTETTIWSSTDTVGEAEPIANIGRPIANTRLYVLDDRLAPVPVGAAGELFIAGDGVTRGYWQRPDLTEERFLPDPFAPPGTAAFAARMYRTGDLVRWRDDGRIDFLGRADHQVKIRGYRIELGEIEAVIEAMPGIAQAVVMAREDTPGDVRLVAYVAGPQPPAEPALKAHLQDRLPAHMVPAHVVRLDDFPLTPNRKVDRKALPAPRAGAVATPVAAASGGLPHAPAAPGAPASVPAAHEVPKGRVQARIAEIWSRILGVPEIGARDNFFALGGHSLLAVQAHREIREALGVSTLSITDIFRFPTLAGLAAHLGEVPAPDNTPAAPVPQDLGARGLSRAEAMAQRRALRANRGR